SFAVHLVVAAVVVLVAAVLRVSAADWGLLTLAVGLVLVAETFNTAIESLARAVDTSFHPRLRDALDIASAAVLLAAGTAVVIGLIVLLPRLFELVS
ncbi:MAG: diacylglycerol kinase family protein, partial [Planctomycetia bacterium]|nr:diacylglycerol kinase family protein [Planctomycetia bacterium]